MGSMELRKVELWGQRPGGRSGRVHVDLVNAIIQLIDIFGPEAVAQVAVLESKVMPVTEKEVIE